MGSEVQEDMIARMRLLRESLDANAATNGRVHARSVMVAQEYAQADAVKGIWALISLGEGDYVRAADLICTEGAHRINLVGTCKVAEKAEPVDVETMELTMIAEAKAWLRSLVTEGWGIRVVRIVHSGQMAAPWGRIVFNLEAAAPFRRY